MYPLLLISLVLGGCSPDTPTRSTAERRPSLTPAPGARPSTRLGRAPALDPLPERSPMGIGRLATWDDRPLVLQHTEIQATVEAGLALVEVTQDFHNPFTEPIDVQYVLPLPPDSAVRGFELICGERVIEGRIRDRASARQEFEQARRQGRRAALLEQMRENLFTQEVAGICPGEDVSVRVEYVQQVARERGRAVLAFPTTVGERYEPTPDLKLPAHVPAPRRGGRDLAVAVHLDEGLPVESLWSDTHGIEVLEEDATGVYVRLDPADGIPNKDVVLQWTLAGETPRAALTVLPPDGDEDGYLALTVEPQLLVDLERQRKRELLFVMDSSCSMSGRPWDTSVAVVETALREMAPDDTFNLVLFSSGQSALFAEPRPATPEAISKARSWLSGSFQGGGTDMDSGIRYSLRMPGDPEALRLMLVLSDGYIGDERAIVRMVEDELGDARIFSLGVGNSVNRLLHQNLARVGRGAVDYQLDGTPIDETVRTFYDRIAHPAMTDLELAFGDLEVSGVYPERIPDLWAGQPLRVVARYRGEGEHTVRLSGVVDGEAYSLGLPLQIDEGQEHEAVRTLWARRKIADLSWDMDLSEPDRARATTEIGLEHHLVTDHTSLVAVESNPGSCAAARTIEIEHYGPAGTRLDTGALPSAKPMAPRPRPSPAVAPAPMPAPAPPSLRIHPIRTTGATPEGTVRALLASRLQRIEQCMARERQATARAVLVIADDGSVQTVEEASACIRAVLLPVRFLGAGRIELQFAR